MRTWTYKNFNAVDNLDTEAAVETLYEFEKTCPLDLDKNHICEGGIAHVDADEMSILLLDKIKVKLNDDELMIRRIAPEYSSISNDYFIYQVYRNEGKEGIETMKTEGWFAIHKCTGEMYQWTRGVDKLTLFE